jgi:hypothetical protein
MKTTIDNQVSILAILWIDFRDEPEYEDFITYCDLALPMAYAIQNGLVKITDKVKPFIEEAFTLLIAGMGIEDTGFEIIDDLLDAQAEAEDKETD